jgi:hypothetical protein
MFAPSVVVGDLNVEGVSITPNKADSPLVVDPDAVLTLAVPFQFLQPIPRRHAQVLERHRSMEQQQLSSRHSLEAPEAWHVLVVKEPLDVPNDSIIMLEYIH